MLKGMIMESLIFKSHILFGLLILCGISGILPEVGEKMPGRWKIIAIKESCSP
jgi:hypothetical protein